MYVTAKVKVRIETAMITNMLIPLTKERNNGFGIPAA
jgi:hypothetical protein